MKFSSILTDKTGLSVSTVAIILSKKADSPDLTGQYNRAVPDGDYLKWRYHVIRIWEIPPAEFLGKNIGLLPLAPLAASRKQLPWVIERMTERLSDQPTQIRQDVFAITRVLMGLRFSPTVIEGVLTGASRMRQFWKASSVYQELAQEIGVEVNRKAILLWGTDRFGEPTKAELKKLNKIGDSDHLTGVLRQIPNSNSWKELLRVS